MGLDAGGGIWTQEARAGDSPSQSLPMCNEFDATMRRSLVASTTADPRHSLVCGRRSLANPELIPAATRVSNMLNDTMPPYQNNECFHRRLWLCNARRNLQSTKRLPMLVRIRHSDSWGLEASPVAFLNTHVHRTSWFRLSDCRNASVWVP